MTDDNDFWQSFVRDVRRISKDKVAPNRRKPNQDSVRVSLSQQISEDMAREERRSFGIETVSKKNRRKIVVEGTLDLHGFTTAEAARELQKFLYVSQYHGKTWVKVITGKSGVLRQCIPELIQSNGSLVSSVAEAKPSDGGSGAVYVRIRKGRGPVLV
ncbi:MAG: Smr/MutS family protein [Holosporales bacterium]|nr:Smr/MutS family protein [Holosporales bacterium]